MIVQGVAKKDKTIDGEDSQDIILEDGYLINRGELHHTGLERTSRYPMFTL